MDNQKGLAHLVIIFTIIIIAAIGLIAITSFKKSENVGTGNKQIVADIAKPEFSADIFNPEKIDHITPLGELNGGYSEFQTIGSVMMDIKPEYFKAGVDVFAPTDMKLTAYAYYKIPPEPANWSLEFQINENVSMRIDHLTDVVEKIKNIANKTPATDSRTNFLKSPIEFSAGEKIASTTGTSLAHNWNIYLYDKSVKNAFVNQSRYENSHIGPRLINGACPFDYYQNSERFISLMGAREPGQSKDCGRVSQDIKGTLAGAWFLEKEDTKEKYAGDYASPFSIYKTSADEIIIFEINKQRFIVQKSDKTFKDPAEITSSHCYELTDHENNDLGYAYLKVEGDKMLLSYSNSGPCPSVFPNKNIGNYYR